MYITNEALLANFDGTGKGTGTFDCWAISNGNNGTQNLSGRVIVSRDITDPNFNGMTDVGGASTHVLNVGELALHSHGHISGTHDHNVTDLGHSHTAILDNQLSSVSLTNSGGGTFSVTNGAISTDLTYAEIAVETAALTTPGNVEFLVRNLPGITLISNGTETINATQLPSNVTVPNHDHGDPDFTHSHNASTNSSTTAIDIVPHVGASEIAGLPIGSSDPHNNLQPYIVGVAIQKIC